MGGDMGGGWHEYGPQWGKGWDISGDMSGGLGEDLSGDMSGGLGGDFSGDMRGVWVGTYDGGVEVHRIREGQ